MALLYPLLYSLEEKEYPPGKQQFHKNVGFPLGLKDQCCTDAEHIPSVTQALTLVMSQFPSITVTTVLL